ncbi:MAG TPA: bifunctional GTP diphosphokinase/guanosine-3',5'-bis pyrophosphate 3'-pyrophosphohydrolase [Gammaproteobacteria bacterium]|nr:bifunctional GTP diphosphokinase/guanosine-3',5'-bis pyrophosphate 3'-pyrophosphohydrolase [Gammaproteobacteria bacterium]
MQNPASLLGRVLGGKRAVDIGELLDKLRGYLPPEQVAEVERAYRFGAAAHAGQRRLSGEPFISHPVAVADILADLHLDHGTLIAALLHDVIEDTPTAREQLAAEFGEEVARLVDGVSKLTQIRFQSRVEAQAENFRKMLLAMSQDIRVILVKLADRLHNMRTLGAIPPAKRRRIARETLEIYVPIANRLGMNTIKLELEDLGFKALYPRRYEVLERRLKKARGNQREVVQTITATIGRALEQEGIRADVRGREKHLYSIYTKMRSKKLSLNEVLDVYGIRITVDKVDTCYRVLGIVHGIYKPVPGKFKDYIAIPKTNGYQSLHTVLFGPNGVPIEAQIRTAEMDRIAESGIAAHWLYKTGAEAASATPEMRAREWLRGVLEMQQGAASSIEFLENVKVDLFPDEVYVFSPQGDIFRLPRGATAVDFAYAVHTDVGNACVGAKIDRKLAPLRTQLASGQTVEIITSKQAKPNPAWLNFVVTAKARANIRQYLKNLKREEAIDLGKRLLDRALAPFDLSVKKLPPDQVQAMLSEFNLASLNDLFESIGLGQRLAPLVARRFVPPGGEEKLTGQGPLAIRGTEGLVVTLARCCHPIPGDAIMGYLSTGRGIVIHRDSCGNLADYRNQPEKWIEVQWEKNLDRDFAVEVRVDVKNERGVLATVAATIAEMGSNIEQVSVQERDGQTSMLSFLFGVRDRRHLAQIMRRIRALPPVMRIVRARA